MAIINYQSFSNLYEELAKAYTARVATLVKYIDFFTEQKNWEAASIRTEEAIIPGKMADLYKKLAHAYSEEECFSSNKN